MQGGSRPQMPQGAGGIAGVPGQTLHSQIPSGMYILVIGSCIFIQCVLYILNI